MPRHDQNDITFFAKTNFRNQERVFGIKTDDRRRHMYVIGKTGMGKTNLLENLAIQDIQKGHGIAFIDPHGDTAEKLIKAIPSHRINDVIYLNPSDQDFPIAFNVMEKVNPEYRHLVASGLVGVFKKIWADSWGPRLEYILRNAILGLLEYPGSTLLGVTRILVDKSYRERVVEKITDPVVRSFWVDEFQNFATESFANILSEARKYHLNLILANQYVTQIDEKVRDAIFGNAGTIVSFRVGAMDAEFLEKEFEPVFMMNDIINLPKYQIYLKLMIDGIAGDAFSATTLPPIKLEDAGNEEKIIQGSRERYASKKDDVEDKIRRLSGMLTAEERQALIKPVNAPRREAPTITRKAPPKPAPVPKKEQVPRAEAPRAPQAAEVLAERPREEAELPPLEEEKKPAEVPAEIEEVPEEEPGAEAAVPRTLYDTVCATCGTPIQVPFKPDGKRPTFCKDCLRDYQRATAKARLEEERKHGAGEGQGIRTGQRNSIKEQPERRLERRVYATDERPVSLAQVQHIGPKKFKSLRKRPEVNLSELRELIHTTQKKNGES